MSPLRRLTQSHVAEWKRIRCRSSRGRLRKDAGSDVLGLGASLRSSGNCRRISGSWVMAVANLDCSNLSKSFWTSLFFGGIAEFFFRGGGATRFVELLIVRFFQS